MKVKLPRKVMVEKALDKSTLLMSRCCSSGESPH